MPLALQHAGDVLLASFVSQWGFFSFFFSSCPPHTPPPLLSLLLRYVDDGKTAAARGKLYKIYVPVHRNRSIETWATLSNASGAVLLKFKVHAHGKSSRSHGLHILSSFVVVVANLLELLLHGHPQSSHIPEK